MEMLQENPAIDIDTLASPPASGSVDFGHQGERYTLQTLRPGSWILVRVTRYSSTPLYTVHELGNTWRAYRHDGRVTRLDAGSWPELLELALA